MKQNLIKSIVVVMALAGLFLMVGDVPDASLFIFSMAKVAGFALLLVAVRIWDKHIPEEEV